MKSKFSAFIALTFTCLHSSCAHIAKSPEANLIFPGENHFKTLTKLTSGGTNAEAYWSFDSENLSFQHKGARLAQEKNAPDCDRIYSMKKDGSDLHAVSNGSGRTTCAFYTPRGNRILFSSTAEPLNIEACPASPNQSQGYVWPIYPTYQIYSAKLDGSDVLPLEPGAPRSYNAETTVCKNGSVVFTSDRDGDLELYKAKLSPGPLGTFDDVKRITKSPGYDGGAVFSPDCSKIAWRASRPREGKELADYQNLLKEHLVRPSEMEIWVASADGTDARQVTDLGGASFSPAFTPDGLKIIFSSNFENPTGRLFNIYLINLDGTHLEQVTHSGNFDSFPMLSPDGKFLAFSSNRAGHEPRETNVFVATWQDDASTLQAQTQERVEDHFAETVAELSAPAMEGRGLGTEGLKRAEDYVVERFKSMGLKTSLQEVKSQGLNFHQIFFSHNITAALGADCLHPVVIGAHLDHLGFGGENSLEPSKKGIHPGVDDNASGVAAVIEIAKILQKDFKPAKNRCYKFVAFTGEEIGTAGSSRWVEAMKKNHITPRAMINLDMVDRMRDNQLIAFGSDSAREWKSILDPICSDARLKCGGGGDGYGPSDHKPFFVAGIPVLHFFTGPHLDYHRPSDTADKINATGGVQAARVIAKVAQ